MAQLVNSVPLLVVKCKVDLYAEWILGEYIGETKKKTLLVQI